MSNKLLIFVFDDELHTDIFPDINNNMSLLRRGNTASRILCHFAVNWYLLEHLIIMWDPVCKIKSSLSTASCITGTVPVSDGLV